MSETRPTPGSDAAIAQGCTCPVLDNGHGNPQIGVTRGWYIAGDCPLHANRASPTEEGTPS